MSTVSHGNLTKVMSLTFACFLAILSSCKTIYSYEDCTPAGIRSSKYCEIAMGTSKAVCNNCMYYPSDQYPMLACEDVSEQITKITSSIHSSVEARFIVMYTVLYVDSIVFDSSLSNVCGVGGASIYCLDTLANEFRVFNYTVDSTVSKFDEIVGLSARLRYFRTKAFTILIDNVLPQYNIHTNSIVVITSSWAIKHMPKNSPFLYSTVGDDEGYLRDLYQFRPSGG